MVLVLDLSYSTPPPLINKPEDTKPWAKPKSIPPCIPCITLLKIPAKYTAACETDE